MRKLFLHITLLLAVPMAAQTVYNVEDCRKMALEHNASIKIAKKNVEAARSMKKAAFTHFLPDFSATGAYAWNQKNMSLLPHDLMLPVGVKQPDGSLGIGVGPGSTPSPNADGTFSFEDAAISNNFTLVDGQPVPLNANGQPFDPSTNPGDLQWKNHAIFPKQIFEMDVRNVFVGGINFLQPIFMGGKIKQMYSIAGYGEKIAEARSQDAITDLLLEVDESYWRVVSLENKVKLAHELKNVVSKLDTNITALFDEGMATKADVLKVKVKMNEADLSIIKAENGLSLSRMALNQVCGLPLDEQINLEDADLDRNPDLVQVIPTQEALDKRPEIQMLTQVANIAKAKEKVMFAELLPTVALTGGYVVTNPSSFNGFDNKFGGMFNFGVVAKVPLFHFGERIHTLNASRASKVVAALELEDAKEKIELQINQSVHQTNESLKKQMQTQKNVESAEENLMYANEGFNEGVITASDVLMAQTAWLSAKSENIDATIDVKLHNLYLQKSLGTLAPPLLQNNK
ncbi:MAG TPA: TolC family protein [Dysgonamonadaceae bacterium]|nr:TolC family protein [Dysgonamonadaceae bacterium]